MAPMMDVNLDEVVEKPRLPAGQPFTFQIVEAKPGIGKEPNKKTGKREPYVNCTLSPLEPEWNDRKVYKVWSLSPGALESDDPTISIKKFFSVIGFQWSPNGQFSTEDMQTIKFVGEINYKEGDNRAQLKSVLRAA